MRKVFVGLLVVIVLLAAAVELLAPPVIEDRIEAHVRERSAGTVGVSADVGPFPVVTRLLATEKVGRLGVTLDEVAGVDVSFASVRFGLRGVALDRAALLNGNIRVRSIDAGEVTATIDVAVLSDRLGVPLRVEGDQLVVGAAEIPVPIDVVSGLLTLPGADVGGLELIDERYLPCAAPPTAELGEGRVLLSCTLEGVPLVLQ